MKKYLILSFLLMLSLTSIADNRIIISKQALRLYVVNEKNDTIFTCRIACGKKFGNKTKVDDYKTPEGEFTILSISNSTDWVYEKDGRGPFYGVYGPWFLRLKVPGFTGIGIHGTSAPKSIGTRCSAGCIRLNNADIKKVRKLCKVGTRVTIEPDKISQKSKKTKDNKQTATVQNTDTVKTVTVVEQTATVQKADSVKTTTTVEQTTTVEKIDTVKAVTSVEQEATVLASDTVKTATEIEQTVATEVVEVATKVEKTIEQAVATEAVEIATKVEETVEQAAATEAVEVATKVEETVEQTVATEVVEVTTKVEETVEQAVATEVVEVATKIVETIQQNDAE